jgi:hypothetical protein
MKTKDEPNVYGYGEGVEPTMVPKKQLIFEVFILCKIFVQSDLRKFMTGIIEVESMKSKITTTLRRNKL